MSVVEKLRERIDELEAQVSDLKRLAFGDVSKVPPGLRVSPSCKKILAALIAREACTAKHLFEALYHDRFDDAPEPNVLSVYMSQLRKALRQIGVEIKKDGQCQYYITKEHKELLGEIRYRRLAV